MKLTTYLTPDLYIEVNYIKYKYIFTIEKAVYNISFPIEKNSLLKIH